MSNRKYATPPLEEASDLNPDEMKYLLGTIAELNFQGVDVLVLASIVNKLQNKIKDVETGNSRGSVHPQHAARKRV